MWQYRNTDELYHANTYKNMNKNLNNELYHSDVYLGKDFSDGIKHWKYIKREKVNGRWRYYYTNAKDKKLNKLAKERKDALEMLRTENKIRGYGDDYGDHFYYKNGKMVEQDSAYKHINKHVSEKVWKYGTAELRDRERKARYEKYLINPMNKVSDKIYSGKQKVSNAINNIKNNIKKKNFSIKQSFKKKQKA